VELDSISHQPGWTRLNDDEVRARHGVYRRCYSEAELDRRWAQLRFVRRRSQAEADGVVAGVTAATSKEE